MTIKGTNLADKTDHPDAGVYNAGLTDYVWADDWNDLAETVNNMWSGVFSEGLEVTGITKVQQLDDLDSTRIDVLRPFNFTGTGQLQHTGVPILTFTAGIITSNKNHNFDEGIDVTGDITGTTKVDILRTGAGTLGEFYRDGVAGLLLTGDATNPRIRFGTGAKVYGWTVGRENTTGEFWFAPDDFTTPSLMIDETYGRVDLEDRRISFLPYSADNVAMSFDAWFNGSAWVSKDAGSNFGLYKIGDVLKIVYNAGTAVDATFSWTDGLILNSSGEMALNTTPVAGTGFVINAGATQYQLGLAYSSTPQWYLGADSGGDLQFHEDFVGNNVTFLAGGGIEFVRTPTLISQVAGTDMNFQSFGGFKFELDTDNNNASSFTIYNGVDAEIININEDGDILIGIDGFTLKGTNNDASYAIIKPESTATPAVFRVMPNTNNNDAYVEIWGTDYDLDTVNYERFLMWYDVSEHQAVFQMSSNGTGLSTGGVRFAPAVQFDGVALISDGSVSAPSIGFASDPDTGFYTVGAGTIAMAINGADYNYWASNSFNFAYDSNANDGWWLNYHGYAAGLTQFRDLNIANGKGHRMMFFDGSADTITNDAHTDFSVGIDVTGAMNASNSIIQIAGSAGSAGQVIETDGTNVSWQTPSVGGVVWHNAFGHSNVRIGSGWSWISTDEYLESPNDLTTYQAFFYPEIGENTARIRARVFVFAGAWTSNTVSCYLILQYIDEGGTWTTMESGSFSRTGSSGGASSGTSTITLTVSPAVADDDGRQWRVYFQKSGGVTVGGYARAYSLQIEQ